MALGITKSYTPTAGDVSNASSYNTDLAALFNAFSGLEAQTSTLGGLTITPSSNSATTFKLTNAAGTTVFSVNTTTASLVIPATYKLFFDGDGASGTTYLHEVSDGNLGINGSNVGIDATKKLYLDGDACTGNTYIAEASADSVEFTVGGATSMKLETARALFLSGSAGTPGIGFSGDADTGLWNGGANQMGLIAGGTNYIAIGTGVGCEIQNADLTPAANTQGVGNAVAYWGDVSYKTLTDRGCLGWFDDGVELQDGTIVSDTEALLQIQKHPTKKTIYGKEMLDYKTFPKVSYKKAETREKGLLPRDENDEPIGGADGIEMTSMFSIMIGAIKELTNRVSALEGGK